jgi:hypothetical protein
MSSPRLVIASVLALLFVAVPRVLADVAPIAANRQISASGTFCFLLPFCTVDASFSVWAIALKPWVRIMKTVQVALPRLLAVPSRALCSRLPMPPRTQSRWS